MTIPREEWQFGSIYTPDEAWLASAAPETILEPELPIVDPHHHLWGRRPPLSARRAAGGSQQRPQHRRHRLSCNAVDVPRRRARRAAAGRRDRVRQRRRGDERERQLRQPRAPAPASSAMPTARWATRSSEVLGAHPRRRRPVPRHPPLRSATTPIRSIGPPADAAGPLLLGDASSARASRGSQHWASRSTPGCYHPQLGELVDLARAFPATPIVLDHVGGAARHRRLRRPTRRAVRRAGRSPWPTLAELPNVNVKLGGSPWRYRLDFHSFSGRRPREQLAGEWRPYLETCIEAFGADRCMFESNFPVDLGLRLRRLWNAFKRIAAGASADEKPTLFAGTAAAPTGSATSDKLLESTEVASSVQGLCAGRSVPTFWRAVVSHVARRERVDR